MPVVNCIFQVRILRNVFLWYEQRIRAAAQQKALGYPAWNFTTYWGVLSAEEAAMETMETPLYSVRAPTQLGEFQAMVHGRRKH